VSSSEVHDHCAAETAWPGRLQRSPTLRTMGGDNPANSSIGVAQSMSWSGSRDGELALTQTRTTHRVRGGLDSKYTDAVSAANVDCETDKREDDATIRCRHTLKRGPRAEG